MWKRGIYKINKGMLVRPSPHVTLVLMGAREGDWGGDLRIRCGRPPKVYQKEGKWIIRCNTDDTGGWLVSVHTNMNDRSWNRWLEYERLVKAAQEYNPTWFLFAEQISRGGGCWAEVTSAPARYFPTWRGIIQPRVDTSKLTYEESVIEVL